MSIPLVQNNEKDSINTSIIAIKRNIERINMLLGLSNSEEIDTSEFVKKSDIVDEVTVGNMQSVTSNAVAVSCVKYPDYANEITVTSSSWTATQNCYLCFNYVGNQSNPTPALKINNNYVDVLDFGANWGSSRSWFGYVKKGDICEKSTGAWKFFALRN